MHRAQRLGSGKLRHTASPHHPIKTSSRPAPNLDASELRLKAGDRDLLDLTTSGLVECVSASGIFARIIDGSSHWGQDKYLHVWTLNIASEICNMLTLRQSHHLWTKPLPLSPSGRFGPIGAGAGRHITLLCCEAQSISCLHGNSVQELATRQPKPKSSQTKPSEHKEPNCIANQPWGPPNTHERCKSALVIHGLLYQFRHHATSPVVADADPRSICIFSKTICWTSCSCWTLFSKFTAVDEIPFKTTFDKLVELPALSGQPHAQLRPSARSEFGASCLKLCPSPPPLWRCNQPFLQDFFSGSWGVWPYEHSNCFCLFQETVMWWLVIELYQPGRKNPRTHSTGLITRWQMELHHTNQWGLKLAQTSMGLWSVRSAQFLR